MLHAFALIKTETHFIHPLISYIAQHVRQRSHENGQAEFLLLQLVVHTDTARPVRRSKESRNQLFTVGLVAIAASLYGGETGCSYGCLGCGDCVAACQFDAIHMNPETGLPEVDEEKCTACGACAKACPKSIIEIRPQGKKSRRIYVQCVNKDKGAVARKACTVACIGCGKCVKVCPFEAITLENNLAYIDPNKCKSCRKCEEACPQNTIIALNFPPRKPKADDTAPQVKVAVPKAEVETPKAEV